MGNCIYELYKSTWRDEMGFAKQRFLKGQGATEYLVLLAVVLVIALIVLSLVGGTGGGAGDASITQNQIYWSSSSPIAITQMAMYKDLSTWNWWPQASSLNVPYFILKNNGANAVRLRAFMTEQNNVYNGGNPDWNTITTAYTTTNTGGDYPLTNIVIQPGEEICIGPLYNCPYSIYMAQPETSYGLRWSYYALEALDSPCSRIDGSGTAGASAFGIQYDEIVGAYSITKMQGMHSLSTKCAGCAYGPYGGSSSAPASCPLS
jgi:hypothetical protein